MTKSIAVLGYGIEGRSAAKYWTHLGYDVTICDQKTDVATDGYPAQLGEYWLDNLDRFDLIVRTPSIRRDSFQTTKPVTSVIKEFLVQCPAPIIGVTGTKGKGTTATLISKILETAGYTVHLGGNIGRAALEFLPEVKSSHWVVLELSSFQLMDITESPQIGVILTISPDHMDWHLDMEEYVEAKGNLVRFQKSDDLVVYHAGNDYSVRLAKHSPGKRRPYWDEAGAYVKDGQVWFGREAVCRTNEVGLIGPHNLENVCAAVAATWDIVSDRSATARAIAEFSGMPYRIEVLGTYDGIRYVNDSFASAPAAAIAALRSFAEPKVVILGGVDRGIDYTELVHTVTRSRVRSVIAIGQTGPKLAEALRKAGYNDIVMGGDSMPQIVSTARKLARRGDVVLLSPGCPSFDMFANFRERGDQFRAAVNGLTGEEA